MKISIITLFPDMIKPFFAESIIKRAVEKGAVEIEIVNLREFAKDKYGSVDDSPYGGGAGMVLRIEPLTEAVQFATSHFPNLTSHVVLTSAKGKPYVQEKAKEFAKREHLIIIAGHYEGVDERIMDHVDEEVSIGDFVMTGGEITAAAVVDSIVRLIPGVLKHEEATDIESFKQYSIAEIEKAFGNHETLEKLKSENVKDVRLLEYPHYTRPEEFEGKKVPEMLLSGDHKKIAQWRLKMAFQETLVKRPDLLGK